MAKGSAAKDSASRLAPSPASGIAAAKETAGLDRIIHERMRLGIVSALAANESLTFAEMKKLLDATDGNISIHARKLEAAEYITCTKTFEGRVPQTRYQITPQGREALNRYLDHMEALVRAMRGR